MISVLGVLYLISVQVEFEFYGPVSTVKVIWSQSINLLTFPGQA